MNRREILQTGLASLSATALAPFAAFGQSKFPERPIRMIIPFSAGGVTDIVGRHWSERMKPVLGTIYTENQGGGAGIMGASEVARAQPDGHTIMLGNTSVTVLHPMTAAKLPYDPARDFAPIAIIAVAATALVVHSSVPAKTVKEFVDYAKANSGKLAYEIGRAHV